MVAGRLEPNLKEQVVVVLMTGDDANDGGSILKEDDKTSLYVTFRTRPRHYTLWDFL